jgi:outer membrane murein-binding lipoprotein Lpp
LYEINAAILDCVDTDTGEVIDFDMISRLVLDKEKKIDNLACWFKELNAEAAAIDFEMKKLAERREAKKNKAESVKKYLTDILAGAKFETARNRITWLPSDEVNIIDPALVPDAYKKEVTDIKISKTDIKKAIKGGFVVDGAELIYKTNIQIK